MDDQIDLFAEDKNMQKVMQKQKSGRKVTQREALTALASMKGTVDLLADDVAEMVKQVDLLGYRLDLLTMSQRTLVSVLLKKELITDDDMKEQWQEELEKQSKAEKEHAEELAKTQQEEADAVEEVKRQSADTAYYKMLAERVEATDMDADRKQYFQTVLQDPNARESAAIELRKEGISLTSDEATDE